MSLQEARPMTKHWKSILLLVVSPFLYLNPIQSLLPFRIHIPVLCLVYFAYLQSKFKYLAPIYLGLILDLFISPIFGAYMLLYFLAFLGLENLNPFDKSPSPLALAMLCFVTQVALVIMERILWIFLGISAIRFSLGPWLASSLGTALMALIIFNLKTMPMTYLTKTERKTND